MIMPREKREIQKEDIIPLDVYTKKRRELRKNIVDYKKNRRVALGPYATFYFESYETMLAQVQEMLYIEKGGDEQLHDELSAYNPLIPNGKELTATLMFEIDNPISRAAFLGKVGGIEETVFMKIDSEKIKAFPVLELTLFHNFQNKKLHKDLKQLFYFFYNQQYFFLIHVSFLYKHLKV